MSTNNTNAEIITIGDEILIGQIVDTNSAWLAQNLNQTGINVYQITSVSDNKDHIINSLNEATLRADLIIITGGLGPTKDDITKNAACEFFNTTLVRNEEVYEQITKRMAARNISMNILNQQQADVPANCTVIRNDFGTAPCMWFEKNSKVYIFLPGVPYEMKGIFTEQLLPKLKGYFNNLSIFHKTLLLQGIPESQLALLIEKWESNLPVSIKLAYLPSPGIVKLRLSARGDIYDRLKDIVDGEVQKVIPIIKQYYLSDEDEQAEIMIYKLFSKNKLTLSVAESCTGGKISNMLTSVPGSSLYFKGGVVAYSNEIKINSLNVDKSIIEQYGAVSEQVVSEMAVNIREIFKTDYSVAVSGIAGPDGGTDLKPVGTVWIAVSSVIKTITRLYSMGNIREQNIQRSANTALTELLKLFLTENNFTD